MRKLVMVLIVIAGVLFGYNKMQSEKAAAVYASTVSCAEETEEAETSSVEEEVSNVAVTVEKTETANFQSSDTKGIEEEVVTEAEEEDIYDYPKMDINYDDLQEINDSYVGTLYIPTLDINYPVAQEESDNQGYYLTHLFNGEQNTAGAVYRDFRGSNLAQDAHTCVYGHNMRNGSMFGSLKTLLYDEKSLESNPLVYIYTEDHVYVYEIFSVRRFDASVTMDAYNMSDYSSYVDEELAEAEIVNQNAANDAVTSDQILTLITCSGAAGGTEKLAVQAVRIH